MQSFRFVLLIFRLEALILIREVTCDVFLCSFMCNNALSLSSHTFVLFLGKEVDFNARQC